MTKLMESQSSVKPIFVHKIEEYKGIPNMNEPTLSLHLQQLLRVY